MQSSIRQWKRIAQVIVGKGGSGLLAENIRIEFEVNKTVDPIPNSAVIRLFNLNVDNEQKVHNEYDEVILTAGYIEAPRMIFRGNIKTVSRYRDGNDRVVEIQAGDGDYDYKNAKLQVTLSAGTSNKQIIDHIISSFKSVIKGPIVIPDLTRLRGRVISGNTRDILNDLAIATGSNWSIQDETLHMISANDVAPGQAVAVNSDTGLLGAPERSDKGISVKTLLNPEIKINGAIHLDNNSIRRRTETARQLATGRETAETQPRPPVRLDPDGIYKVIRVLHKGDTRSNEWTTQAECIGIDQPIPKSRVENQGIL